MRLTEGFSFAHSSAGIINMVLEIQMQGPANENVTHPCVIQYVLFPPHTIASPSSERDSGSEEDTDEGTKLVNRNFKPSHQKKKRKENSPAI